MNNAEYNRFRKEILKYKNLVSREQINNISREVREGTKTRNQGLVEAYNEANIEYRAQMTGYYPTLLMKFIKMLFQQKIITGRQMRELKSDRAMRAFVRELAGDGPRRPPCVKIQNVKGCSNASKSVQGFVRSTRRAVTGAITAPFRAGSRSSRGGT